jgi:hypothetical protein
LTGATTVQNTHSQRAVELARSPWSLGSREGQRLLVRGVRPTDLAAIATFHGRCSRQTLLQRYRHAGSAPSLPALTLAMAEPLLLAVLSAPGKVVGLGSAVLPNPADRWSTEIGLIVQDDDQGQGIGTALARHLAASLRMMGTGQLLTRSATPSLPLHSVMEKLGPTRARTGVDASSELTTRIDVRALDGFGGDLARASRVQGIAG